MASEKILNQKKEEVTKLANKIKEAKLVLLTDYRGINVEDVTSLRADLRKSNTEYCVIKNNIRYATESEYNINRFSKLLKNLDINHNIEFDGKSFIITLKAKDCIEEVDIQNGEINIKNLTDINENEKKAIIRGTFLGAGSINNPEKKYHLEINLANKINLDYLFEIISSMNIKCKKLELDKKYSIYIKDGEEISLLIALMGANKSVLNFEDIRVQREMRGKVNRLVNCKSANLNKTLKYTLNFW